MATNKVFRLFDLPPELRGAIFSQLLVSNESVILHETTFFTLPSTQTWNFLNVFLVNMQMYQEASAIFYSQNRFTLNAHYHRLPTHLTSRGGFLSEEGQHARRRVRSMTIYLTRVGGEFERVLGPALSDMVLNGSLRELVIRLGPPSSLGANRTPHPDMVQRPPFQGLLRLLADPYLERVKLLAWKAHLAVFCPFHREVNTSTITDNETVDSQGTAIIRNSTGWIELDWRAMVDVYAPGQKIVRIGDRNY
ncbi:uncharacterized protein F4807DRAFT_460857 [Annulohypoxylon truncatum]|uniref:uncharacterized protein n=1 Tax=Annulohypoxylon truncatum TaxID=327061 RepID=UPI0020076C68|nr:uncharacterized protein F4807DRAFT_460857 [Annulohypoxylon truncatum]KAI1209163.1 hypothetical protein F4807DRAFT_460857 [Annulohypoxylon truncatum]